MTLTDTAIKNSKPKDKPIKVSDGGGLYLLIKPNGSRWWRLDYRFGGKRKTLSMGIYPDVPLKAARERRDEARTMLAAGADPGEQRKAVKKAKAEAGFNTFEALGREWMATRGKEWTASYASKTASSLERHAFPAIGAKPITEITAPELLALLRAIEGRGTVDLAHRISQHCSA
ncbi:MAG TPA: integrase arm-type DNA-binding domain-containing protein, partial [Rhodocyclaceae bacterium]|nr:integrase arm-type DNA-binding domain-containing protein [Rhodocyclaceae bacterium]